MKKIRLLLVDDQELIRESLAFVLNTDEDIDVVGLAANGQEAIDLCEELQPTMVLMDIKMPVLNGIEATKVIKQNWPEIKIMILTTFQEVEQVVEALSIGAEGYLLKAIHPKDLISGIKHIQNNGTLLSQDLAKALVEQVHTSRAVDKASKPKYGLTEREEQILQCLANGLSNKQISEKLFLSEGTVKNYISSIYHKLDVKDRFQAAQKAKDEDIVK
ncbi:DNA-binding NarL/FixJ family response regulator [Ureibacillus xyleni]|uniref:DNA-binding NarL/FixJ family response regulator n=1 Tax=Ureibacillus xyleni TaxID=614648 RepID=A0A285SKA5_9BACL|nr:response regulator transcription factor [Ureibacillus xyleni]SOC08444.1 DNA-binding NarL/FixJ family response regulator [Ureibacillus xyleni]